MAFRGAARSVTMWLLPSMYSWSRALVVKTVSPNNRMQRAGSDKVHAPDRHLCLTGIGYALRARRSVADAGRYAQD
jgi:hypothetical protein